MIKKIILILLFFLLIPFYAQATTYYMANNPCSGNSGWGNGSDSTEDGTSKLTPYLTLSGAFAAMSAGDTLIIDDGIYTGASNVISQLVDEPPVGNYGADEINLTEDDIWTIIKAENDGEVEFDGEDTRFMFYVSDSGSKYWQFEGIVWSNSSSDNVYLAASDYVKFLRCGAYDVANGNTANFDIGTDSSYILLEGCYSYGTGRYKFLTYHADHIILRNCVGRPDAMNPLGEPAAVFSIYSSAYVKVQNCIAIDADQTSYWANIGGYVGSFYVPCTTGISQYVDFDQSIALNVKLGGLNTMQNTDSANVNYRNIVVWDSTAAGSILNTIRGSSNLIQNVTMGNSDSSTTYIFYWDGSSGTSKNNIFYHLLSSGNFYASAPATQDYNLYYANSNTTGRTGTNDITATDPTSNSLFYLPRIEAGSDLKGAGESEADIGANVLTLIGTSGTLWGEDGYATDTTNAMWPFPNEALIRSKMKVYTWDDGGGGDPEITGDRGFCADGKTLTDYIIDYLGTNVITVTGTTDAVTVQSSVDDWYAGSDVTAPTYVSSEIMASGTFLKALYSDSSPPLQFGAGGSGGGALANCSGGATTLGTPLIDGLYVIWPITNRTVISSETGCEFTYTQPTDGLQDSATTPNDVATHGPESVTNNSGAGNGSSTATVGFTETGSIVMDQVGTLSIGN